jgi:hypothetical protein
LKNRTPQYKPRFLQNYEEKKRRIKSEVLRIGIFSKGFKTNKSSSREITEVSKINSFLMIHQRVILQLFHPLNR